MRFTLARSLAQRSTLPFCALGSMGVWLGSEDGGMFLRRWRVGVSDVCRCGAAEGGKGKGKAEGGGMAMAQRYVVARIFGLLEDSFDLQL